jgi:hypothetical protein
MDALHSRSMRNHQLWNTLLPAGIRLAVEVTSQGESDEMMRAQHPRLRTDDQVYAMKALKCITAIRTQYNLTCLLADHLQEYNGALMGLAQYAANSNHPYANIIDRVARQTVRLPRGTAPYSNLVGEELGLFAATLSAPPTRTLP